MQNHTHLKPEERAMIMVEIQRGTSLRAISRILNRAPSSISRELNRNRCNDLSYCAVNAANNYHDRRKDCVRPLKLIEGYPLYLKIHDWLVYRQWSPMQISGTLKRLYSDNRAMQVSHETIYASIYAHPKGELKKPMMFIWNLSSQVGRCKMDMLNASTGVTEKAFWICTYLKR